MNAVAQWSEGTRSAVLRAGVAGVAALILVLFFGIYIYFFPTPLSTTPLFEQFVAGNSRLREEPASLNARLRNGQA